MTRWISILMGVLLLSTGVLAFSDVPPGHWAYEAIETLAKAGLVEPGIAFNGNSPLTRYEMALLVAQLLEKGGASQPGMNTMQRELFERLQIEFEEDLRRVNEKYFELRQQAITDRGRLEDLRQQQERTNTQMSQLQRDLSGVRSEVTGISNQSSRVNALENEVQELRKELEAQATVNRRLFFAIGVLGAVLLLLQIS